MYICMLVYSLLSVFLQMYYIIFDLIMDPYTLRKLRTVLFFILNSFKNTEKTIDSLEGLNFINVLSELMNLQSR